MRGEDLMAEVKVGEAIKSGASLEGHGPSFATPRRPHSLSP